MAFTEMGNLGRKGPGFMNPDERRWGLGEDRDMVGFIFCSSSFCHPLNPKPPLSKKGGERLRATRRHCSVEKQPGGFLAKYGEGRR